MPAILAKAAVTIVAVLVLAELSRRVSPTLAGIVSGLPLGSGLTMLFVALEQGPGFAVEAAPYGILGLASSLAFSLAYLVVGRASRLRPGLVAVMASTSAGLVAFLASALVFHRLRVSLAGATAMTVAAVAVNLLLLARLPVDARPFGGAAPGAARSLLARAMVAGGLVAAVTAAARVVGSAWTGLFSGFPIVLMPLYIVLQYEQGDRLYPGVIRGFAWGVTNLIIFYLLLAALLPALGVGLGFVVVYAVSIAYLWGLSRVRGGRARGARVA